MSKGLIQIDSLITSTFKFDDAVNAYKKINDKNSIGILLNYKDLSENKIENKIDLRDSIPPKDELNISFIGAGNYASRTLIPNFKKTKSILNTIVTSEGLNGTIHGKKTGFFKTSTEFNDALKDDTDVVVIATQHNLHAKQIIAALKANKHVFVEKPLALTLAEIDAIEEQYNKSNSQLMVGYNRRFSPLVTKTKELLKSKLMPKVFVMTMNAGKIPADHWTQNLAIGGGRIIGEACHYIDLMRFLANSEIVNYHISQIGDSNYDDVTSDKSIITLHFRDGSIGTINYLANGGKVFPKERIEIFCDDAVLQLNNFKSLKGYGWNGFRSMSLLTQDKGQKGCCAGFIQSIKEGANATIPSNEIFEVARVTVNLVQKNQNLVKND